MNSEDGITSNHSHIDHVSSCNGHHFHKIHRICTLLAGDPIFVPIFFPIFFPAFFPSFSHLFPSFSHVWWLKSPDIRQMSLVDAGDDTFCGTADDGATLQIPADLPSQYVRNGTETRHKRAFLTWRFPEMGVPLNHQF